MSGSLVMSSSIVEYDSCKLFCPNYLFNYQFCGEYDIQYCESSVLSTMICLIARSVMMILGLAKPSLRFMSEVVKPPRESSQGTLTSQCTNRCTCLKQRLRINQTISYRSILAHPSRTFVLSTRQKDKPV